MNRYSMTTALGTAVGVAVLIASCGVARAEDAPTLGSGAVLPDLRYVWFLYGSADSPQLDIWRVQSRDHTSEGKLVCKQFRVAGDPNERLCAWDAYGDWVWVLTNRGVRRIGRLWPAEGISERFEPELISPEVIGYVPVGIVVVDPRILIAGDRGLFVFERQHRKLTSVTDTPIKKLRKTRLGIIVQTSDAFFLFDTSSGKPKLKELKLEEGRNWREQVTAEAYVLAGPEDGGVWVIKRDQALSFDLEQLRFEFAPDEELRDACLYAGRLWLLTTGRLVALDPGVGIDVQYDLSGIELSNPQLTVQHGGLRCGPIAIRLSGDHFQGRVVSLLRGAEIPAHTEALTFAGVQQVKEKLPTEAPETPPH